MKFIATLIFLIVPFTNDWKTFQNSDFSIKYPADWELNLSGASGTKFILFAPSAQAASFRDNINLVVEDLKNQKIDLKEYTKLSIAQVKQYISNANILVSETLLKNQKQKLVYTGSQGDLKLQFQQFYWIKNKKAYVLTFTSSEKTFNGQIENVTRIMNSFTIK